MQSVTTFGTPRHMATITEKTQPSAPAAFSTEGGVAIAEADKRAITADNDNAKAHAPQGDPSPPKHRTINVPDGVVGKPEAI